MSQNLPIVLAHGIARFDVLLQIQREKFNLPENRLDDEFQYFKGIKTHLEKNGFAVFHTDQDFAGSVDLRAAQLKRHVDKILSQTGAEKVHIIAHSMGGLDARRMIVDLEGMAEKVASLTTIGTPHLGTILADHVINSGGKILMEILDKAIDLRGFNDLTVTECEKFNLRAESFEARNQVVYQTYASSEDFRQMFSPLVASWLFIREHEGRNDGLVPFKSQQWKPELTAENVKPKPVAQKEFSLPADHLNQIGWWDFEETIFLGGSLFKQKIAYEDRIKDIYLEIARNLPQI